MNSRRSENHMRIVGMMFVCGFLTTAPALAQIVRPVLTPPPCSGNGCMQRPRPASPVKLACPPGTVYVPKKGTCKVLPPNAPANG
jgi:hypothetical protein